MGLVNISPVLSKLDNLNAHYSILRVGAPGIVSNPSLLREELGGVSSHQVVCCAGGMVYEKIVSQLPLPISMCIFFLICPMCRHSASFWISFRGNYSISLL